MEEGGMLEEDLMLQSLKSCTLFWCRKSKANAEKDIDMEHNGD